MTTTSVAFEMLFSEFVIGGIRLKNRLVALPHGTALVRNGVPTDDDQAYWEARAAGGLGLVITGGTIVHPTTSLRTRQLTEAYNEASWPALRQRVEAVHRHGASAGADGSQPGHNFDAAINAA